jgi:hypothetical protein
LGLKRLEGPKAGTMAAAAQAGNIEGGTGVWSSWLSALMNDPLHWRALAMEARELANTMDDDPDAKQRMLEVADSYDQIAELAANRQKRMASPPHAARR